MQKIREMLMNDLDAAFKSIITANTREGRIMHRPEICEIISKLPAPRIYVTPEYALRVVRGYPRCGARKASLKMKQQDEIRRRYNSLPSDMRTLANLAKLLAQPAECFYITPLQISNILYELLHAKKN